MQRARTIVGIFFICALAGCGPEALETGYKPRPLNDSPITRRSYYASPFSPEATAPRLNNDQEIEQRHPRPGY